MITTNTQDVLIIGGGPAGSSSAAFLAKQGYKVTLFEKEKFPREHVGESLLPFCFDLFEELGVLDQMKQRYVRKPGVRFITSDGTEFSTWCFDRVIDDESYRSFQVKRADFDQMLLNNAAQLGATVHEETRVSAVDLDGPDGGVRVETVDADGNTTTHEGRFLIDASGRSTFMGLKNRSRRPNKDLQRTALWTHYRNADLQGGLDEGLSMIVYLHGDKKGWAWVFPLGKDLVTVGFVADNAYIKSQKKELEPTEGENWQLALFEQEIAESPFITQVVSGAERCLDLHVNGDYSYFVDTKYGPNFALIGDSGRFIDPIFSSGVFLSIKSARIVTDAIGQMLSSGSRDLAPLDEKYTMINGAYDFVHRMIKLFYNPHALSWATAAPGGVEDAKEYARSHGDAMAAGHYMLAGDFFENQEKYHDMFDLLEKPRDFARYKKLVIDQKRFQDVTCRREGSPDNFPE